MMAPVRCQNHARAPPSLSLRCGGGLLVVGLWQGLARVPNAVKNAGALANLFCFS